MVFLPVCLLAGPTVTASYTAQSPIYLELSPGVFTHPTVIGAKLGRFAITSPTNEIYTPAFVNTGEVAGNIALTGLYKNWAGGAYYTKTDLNFKVISVAYPAGLGGAPILQTIYGGRWPVISWDAVTITEIRHRIVTPFRKSITQELPEAGSVLGDNDVLYLVGDFVNVSRFVEENGLNFLDRSSDDSIPSFSGKLKFDEIGMAEVVVLANSNIIGRPVKESGFRNNYNVNIIGIQRKDALSGAKCERRKNTVGRHVAGTGHLGRHRQVKPIAVRDCGDWPALGGGVQGAARGEGTCGRDHYGIDGGGNDIQPLPPRSSGIDGCCSHDPCGMFPERTRCLSYHQLGERCPLCRHDATGNCHGEDGNIGADLFRHRRIVGEQRTTSGVGWNLSGDLHPDDVYQQHGDSYPVCTHCIASRCFARCQSLSVSGSRGGCCQHVFCKPLLHTSKRHGDVGRALLFHGLCEGGTAPPGCAYGAHGICPAATLPLLNSY